MYWRIPHKVSVFFLALVLVGCAARPPRPEPAPTAEPVGIGEAKPPTTTVPPVEPAQPGMELPKVTLVLGGAGVASFATVGLLKRFQEEGIKVDTIVATGWPTLFALGYSFLKSVHDLEWFAMRLEEKDFYKAGMFNSSSGYASHEVLSKLIQTSFKTKELGDGKVKVVISATNTELGEPEIFDSGDWRAPLLKTMSVPGIYRPYPQGSDHEFISSLSGIDVAEAKRRGGDNVVAILMYDDYFRSLKNAKKNTSDNLFRQLYSAQLRKSIAYELKDLELVGRISLNAPPGDFTAKRLAIFSGYKEGARLARIIRSK